MTAAASSDRARERRCVVTGDTPPEADLVRFALSPDGVVTPDVAAKLPGRGAWARADRETVMTAVKRNAFARAFKAAVKAPSDLADAVEAALARRCLDILSMGRKAGAITFGFDQVEAALRGGPVHGLIEAADGAADGREKLRRAAGGRPIAMVGCFTAAELGMALGRDRVVHACWLQERMARLWAVEIGRLSGFRAVTPESWRVERTDGSDAAEPAPCA
ncbi:MAG: RNA-binding protein [Hyphomonadaceae bacterium]